MKQQNVGSCMSGIWHPYNNRPSYRRNILVILCMLFTHTHTFRHRRLGLSGVLFLSLLIDMWECNVHDWRYCIALSWPKWQLAISAPCGLVLQDISRSGYWRVVQLIQMHSIHFVLKCTSTAFIGITCKAVAVRVMLCHVFNSTIVYHVFVRFL